MSLHSPESSMWPSFSLSFQRDSGVSGRILSFKQVPMPSGPSAVFSPLQAFLLTRNPPIIPLLGSGSQSTVTLWTLSWALHCHLHAFPFGKISTGLSQAENRLSDSHHPFPQESGSKIVGFGPFLHEAPPAPSLSSFLLWAQLWHLRLRGPF